jgi:N-acetylglucosaminyldiphosphoundecaprenol N-acetyl-beta-D-mannosaminyltransferase
LLYPIHNQLILNPADVPAETYSTPFFSLMPKLDSTRSAVILGVPFHDVTLNETIARLASVIEHRDPVYWATANLDFAYQASVDVELQRILVESDLVLCDGKPLVWASRMIGAPLREPVASSDLMPRIAQEAAARGWKVFLLGGGQDALAAALIKLRARYSNLQVDGYSSPYAQLLEIDFENISTRIAAAKPDILLVAFGCPKQEKWIYINHRRLGVPMCVGIGATVDLLGGKFRQAPRWMKIVGAEWLFRLRQEPRRLFNRYLIDLLFFVRALRAQRRALSPNTPAPSTSEAVVSAAPVLNTDIRTIVWRGRIDTAAISSGQVPAPAADLPPGGVVALDLSDVTFIDSTGLGFLLSGYRRSIASGGGLVLVRPSSAVTGLVAAMKLDRILPVVEEAARARAALGLTAPARTNTAAAEDLVLSIQGELTATRVPGLSRWIEQAWSARTDATRLVLDLSAVRFMDSSGLGLLIQSHRLAAARSGSKLVLRQPSENVRNVLRLAKVDGVLNIE